MTVLSSVAIFAQAILAQAHWLKPFSRPLFFRSSFLLVSAVFPLASSFSMQPAFGIMSFINNGCCGYDGFGMNAGPQSAQTKAILTLGNCDPTYNAAEDKYLDGCMVFEENVTYICLYFYCVGLMTACGTDSTMKSVYKKDCTNASMIQCPLSAWQFVSIGCCRYDSNGNRGKVRGTQAEANNFLSCISNPTCLSADVSYLDIDIVLVENATYVGFSLFGTGPGFTVACGTNNYQVRCYRKVRQIISATITTYLLSDVQTVVNDCCHYCNYSGSGVKAKLRSVQTEADCFRCDRAS